MSKTTKLIAGIIILIVVIGIIISISSSEKQPATPVVSDQTATTTEQSSASQSLAGLGLSAQDDISNTALQNDASSVDIQLNNLGADITSIDQALLTQ